MKTTPAAEAPDDLIPICAIRPGEYVYTPGTIRKKVALRLIPSYRISNRTFVSKRVLEELGRPVPVAARGSVDLSAVRGLGVGLGPGELSALALDTVDATGCLFSEAVAALVAED